MRILIINEHVKDKLGGSEIQCDLIANELQKLGHEVHYLAVKGSGSYSSSYNVHPLDLNDEVNLRRLIGSIKPDIIYWRYNRKFFYSSVKRFKSFGIPVIFSVSHEYDVTKFRSDLLRPSGSFKNTLRNWRNFIWNLKQFRGFENVDGISNQCREFMGKLGIEREIYFPNSVLKGSAPFEWDRPFCLWASSIKKRKNPEDFIKLASELQHENVDFLMVGEIQDAAYNYLQNPDSTPPNLHYLGVKSYREVNGMLEKALMLIHTCNPEGFPNNFVQAWAFGKPVVSLYYDPDGIIESKNLGSFSKTFDRFKKDVESWLHNAPLREEAGARAKEFSETMFDPAKNVKKLETFMVEIIEESPSPTYYSSS